MITPNSVALLFGAVAKQYMKVLPCKYKIFHCHPVSRANTFDDKNVFGEANKCMAEMGYAAINWTPGFKYRERLQL
jgi:uracil DNA glycosylase